MNAVKYYVSGALFVLLCLLDAFFALMLIASFSEGATMIITSLVFLLPLLFITKKCRSWHKKIDLKNNSVGRFQRNEIECESDEPLFVSGNELEESKSCLKPNFEIKYKSAEDEVTVRKIYARNFDGKVLDAYCFLRNENRTFYIPRIIECVDLETGEVLSSKANGDLRWYFNQRFKKNFKPSDMFEFREWNKITFSTFTPFSDDISGFDVDDDFKMRIVTYKEGFISGKFHCGKVYSSMYEDDGFYLVLDDINGNRYNVDLNKIVSVDGVDDIGQYINEKFLNSNEGKARRLQKECEDELSIFVYLGRADDASINEKKRRIICDYLTSTGRDCTNEILAIVAKRIKVDTNEFKKIVNAFSKCIDISAKPLLLEAANQIVGGRAKAKPFGLAGLQYIESKIKV